MSSASKVGEIFSAAGAAFSKLGELTMQLHPTSEASPITSGKWTQKEIEMLRFAVNRFGEDLNKISEVVKSRSIAQIKAQLKQKAFTATGLSPEKEEKKVVTPERVVTATTISSVKHPAPPSLTTPDSMEPPSKKPKQSDVTLSALNAPESDVDIETLGEQAATKKLEFDSDMDASL